jgi:hypothetical protein
MYIFVVLIILYVITFSFILMKQEYQMNMIVMMELMGMDVDIYCRVTLEITIKNNKLLV